MVLSLTALILDKPFYLYGLSEIRALEITSQYYTSILVYSIILGLSSNLKFNLLFDDYHNSVEYEKVWLYCDTPPLAIVPYSGSTAGSLYHVSRKGFLDSGRKW